MTPTAPAIRDFARLHLPMLVLAVGPALLALRFGGFHPRDGGWVALAVAVWACVQAARGRLPELRSTAGIASVALVALAGWTIASISWADTSTHDAWVESVRNTGYAAAFVLGASLLANIRRYGRFVAAGGMAIGALALVTLVRMSRGDDSLTAFVAGRLDWPVGYAPGLAALHVIGVLLLLGASCACGRAWDEGARLRAALCSGGLLALAGACAVLAVLAQSRGTVPALAIALVIGLIAAPRRGELLLRIVALGAVLLAVRPTLAEVFQTQFAFRQAPFTEGADADALLQTALEAAHAAGRAGFGAVAALFILGALVVVPLTSILTERMGELQERIGTGLVVPAAVLAVALVATLLVLGAGKRPVDWVSSQWNSCIDPPSQVNDPGSATSYFANTGTGRCDYYRVALRDLREHPITGTGGGNFAGSYVQHRETGEEPTTVHSLPLQLAGELGIIGLLLGGVVLGCIGVVFVQLVGSGPERDPAFAGALAAIAYWVAHASIDWLWQLPAVTYPILLLAGGLTACASGRLEFAPTPRVAAPIAVAGILAVVALTLPPTMADRALREARDPELQRKHPQQAIDAARRASSFDPGWAQPYVVEGLVLLQNGFPKDAATAARNAIDAEPDDWSVQYSASTLFGTEDPAAAKAALKRARQLNPQLD